MATPPVVRLPITYDPARMLEALEQISTFQMGERPALRDPPIHAKWGGTSLHALGGRWNDVNPIGPALEGFRETEVLQAAPYFKYVLDSLPCPKQSVRLSVLWPGGGIHPHNDPFLGFGMGVVRLHIPINTSPEVEFVVDGQRCEWNPGELWYGDFSQTHHVYNKGSKARVHIVADVCVNEAFLSLFPPEFIAEQGPILHYEEPLKMTDAQLAKFACSFEMSGSLFGIPIAETLPPEWKLAERFHVEARPRGGQLVMALNGVERIGLEPLSGNRFRFLGGPAAAWFEFDMAQDKVVSAVLKTPLEELRFPVSV